MKFVLDASVGLKVVLREDLSDKAINLLEEFRRHVHELLVPETFLAEVAHALTRAERRRVIPSSQASILFTDLLTPPPEVYPIAPLISRAIELSSQLRIGVFDCIYVALAEREGCDLVTADEKLIKALPGYPVVFLDSL